MKYEMGEGYEKQKGRVEKAAKGYGQHSWPKKKEEFPGIMFNTLPGNSFPQICVVSVNESVEIDGFTQDYGTRVHISNLADLLISNR